MSAESTKTDAVAVDSLIRPPPRADDQTGGVPLLPPLKPTDLGTLGPYRVIRALGRGGMGMVFLGVDPKLRRKVALKVILPKYMAKPQARDRFLREARALAAFRNEHVVTIYQVDESEGVPYLALEYLQGSTLEDYLRTGKELSHLQLVHVAREVAVGLAAAHEHGVIHRDVKPANIWLEAPDGRVKLIDFGLARLPTQAASANSDGTVLGTPAYMSPEQARGLEIDARSDLFSLGGVIYRLIAGCSPFGGDSPFAQVMALAKEPHVPLIQRVPTIPESLSTLVDRLLAKDPAARPANARDVARELKRIEAQIRNLESDHSVDMPSSKPHVLAVPHPDSGEHNAWVGLETDSPSMTPSNSSRFTQPAKAHPVWPWLVGALAAATVAVYVGLATNHRKATPAVEDVPSSRRGETTKLSGCESGD